MAQPDRVVLRDFLNATFQGRSTAYTFTAGAGSIIALQVGWCLFARGRLYQRLRNAIFRLIRIVAAPIVNREIAKASSGFTFKLPEQNVPVETLPAKGSDTGAVIKAVSDLHNELDEDYLKGGLSGTVYHGGVEYTTFINKVMDVYQWSNPLHVDTFPAVRKMESEIVAMTLSMYHGEAAQGQCGSLTTGGTESICMALKTYRDFAKAMRGITRPNLVMPITAHPAFDKGCGYYGIEVIKVPVSSVTGRVDPAELEKYINYNTIAIVGSSPCYPYGTIDPIKELSDIALRHGVGMHVDACLGGFVVPFLEKAGAKNAPIVDFRLPGVTTISCDTHKFGYAPKGTSVVMYRTQALRRFQYFSVADWPGGLYASPSAPGSKPGNCIAGTWAAMVHFGEAGYVQATADIQATLFKIKDGLRRIPSVYILGNPTVCAIAFTTDEVDVYVVNDKMQERGWYLNPLQFPSGILFSLTLLHTRGDIADRFIADVREIVLALRKDRKDRVARGEAVEKIGDQGGTMYGGQQRIADRTILEDVTKAFFDSYYATRPQRKVPKPRTA